jgi:hypothetical protein
MKAIAHLMDWAGFRANRAAATGIFPIRGAERNALYFDPKFCRRGQRPFAFDICFPSAND